MRHATVCRQDAGSTLGVTVKPPLNKYALRRGVPHPPTQHRAEQEFGAPFARAAQEASQRRLMSAADSERQARMGIAALLCCLLFTACSKETSASKASSIEPPPQAEAAQQSPDPDVSAKAAQSTELRQTVADAKKMLTGGSYDEAAARLLKMQINGARFSDKDAAAYRETLQEAYSRALEAASNGDPKGKAALEMIRAARGR